MNPETQTDKHSLSVSVLALAGKAGRKTQWQAKEKTRKKTKKEKAREKIKGKQEIRGNKEAKQNGNRRDLKDSQKESKRTQFLIYRFTPKPNEPEEPVEPVEQTKKSKN